MKSNHAITSYTPMKGIFLNAEFYNQKWRKYQTDGLIHF